MSLACHTHVHPPGPTRLPFTPTSPRTKRFIASTSVLCVKGRDRCLDTRVPVQHRLPETSLVTTTGELGDRTRVLYLGTPLTQSCEPRRQNPVLNGPLVASNPTPRSLDLSSPSLTPRRSERRTVRPPGHAPVPPLPWSQDVDRRPKEGVSPSGPSSQRDPGVDPRVWTFRGRRTTLTYLDITKVGTAKTTTTPPPVLGLVTTTLSGGPERHGQRIEHLPPRRSWSAR